MVIETCQSEKTKLLEQNKIDLAEKDSEISSPEDLDQSDADPRVDNFIKSLEQKEGMLQQVKLLMKVVNYWKI